MASLVDAPSMAVDPAEAARASTTPPSKSHRERDRQRRRAAERKRACRTPDAPRGSARDGAGHSAEDRAGDRRRRYRERGPR